MNDLTVRLATVDDLAWWASVEHLPPDLVKRTIEGEEALIAELAAGRPPSVDLAPYRAHRF